VKDQKKSGFFTSKEKKAQNEKEIEEFKQILEHQLKSKQVEHET
jgi:hypothetical protein